MGSTLTGPLDVIEGQINASLNITQSILWIFAGLSMMAIVVLRTMPEPFGKPMLNTIEDAKKLYGDVDPGLKDHKLLDRRDA